MLGNGELVSERGGGSWCIQFVDAIRLASFVKYIFMLFYICLIPRFKDCYRDMHGVVTVDVRYADLRSVVQFDDCLI